MHTRSEEAIREGTAMQGIHLRRDTYRPQRFHASQPTPCSDEPSGYFSAWTAIWQLSRFTRVPAMQAPGTRPLLGPIAPDERHIVVVGTAGYNFL